MFWAVYFWVPFLLRCLSSPLALHARFFGFFQDLFIFFEIYLFGSILIPLPVLGFLYQFYLLADAFLFRKMQIRMNLKYLYHFRHLAMMRHSVSELGARPYLLGALI